KMRARAGRLGLAGRSGRPAGPHQLLRDQEDRENGKADRQTLGDGLGADDALELAGPDLVGAEPVQPGDDDQAESDDRVPRHAVSGHVRRQSSVMPYSFMKACWSAANSSMN